MVTLAATLACAVTTQAAAEPLSLQDFSRDDEFGAIKISPDGTHIAVTTGQYGRSVVNFVDLANKKVVGGTRMSPDLEIGEFHWVSNERVILFVTRQSASVRRRLTDEIIAIDRDGRNQELIYGYRAPVLATGPRSTTKSYSYADARLISTLRADDRHVLMAEYPWQQVGDSYYSEPAYSDPDAIPQIVRLDVYSGKKTDLGSARLAGATVLVDRQDNVRFATGYDKQQRRAVIWKPTPAAAWEEFQLPGFRDQTVEPLQFAPDDKSVLFRGVREGESLASLNHLDLETRAIRLLYIDSKVDIDAVVNDLTDGTLVGVQLRSAKPEFHWLADQKTTHLYRSLQKAFPQQAVDITSASQDGRKVIAFVYSDTNPGEYFLFDVATSKADFLRAARHWIDPRRMRPMQPIVVTARDGLPLAGYLTEPAGTGPHPLIVLPHGGPHGIRDEWRFDSQVQLLASRGYAVLQVNFRGSGGYGIDFMRAGYREWGAKMQDDLTDATRWAIDKGITSKDRICIYGTNYGGYAALMGAVREPTLYRCAIGFAGVYDLELMLDAGDVTGSRIGRDYLQNVLGADPAELRVRSPVFNAQAIRIPILLMHGKQDLRADYAHSVKMKAALEKNGKSLEWMALGKEIYSVYDQEDRLQTYQKLLGFLAKHLPVERGETAASAPAN